MTYSQKYTVVHFLNPLSEGQEFSMDNWPLHTTLADVFAIDLNDKLYVDLQSFASFRKPVLAYAIDDAKLGSIDNEINVTLLEKTPDLQNLHDKLVDLLTKNGAVFNSPQFTHDGFLPHCTIQNGSRIKNGNEVKVQQFSIVDMFVSNDWRQRRVIKNFSLAG